MPVEPADPAPAQPEPCGNCHDSAKRELQCLPGGTAGDGAETGISLMAARYIPVSSTFRLLPPGHDAGDQHKEQGQRVAAAPPRRPSESDVPQLPRPSQTGDEQQLRLDFRYAGPGGLPLPPPGSTYVIRVRRRDGAAAPPRRAVVPHSDIPSPWTTVDSVITLTQEDDSRVGLTPAWAIDGVSTLAAETAPGGGSDPPMPPPQRTPARTRFRREKPPAALCFTACCILFWLLALAIGFALLVVYLRYHLQPPRMRVTSATLSLGGQEANYSLTIQADIYSPNTKLLHVVLCYVPLDLYFNGSLIGTGAVWPVLPIHHEAPGDSSSSVQLSGSVTLEKDVALWQKATSHNDDGGVPLELRLVGTFHAQLSIGRWLPSFRFSVHPRCTLWLDPSGGALRRSRCSPDYLTK